MSEDRSLERLRALEAENTALRAQLAALGTAPLQHGLSKREALLVEAERVAHLGSWAWDLATGEIEWSDELYRILGYDPARTSPSSEAFFAAIHEEDRERVRAVGARSLQTSHSAPVSFRVARKDGEVRSVRMEGAILQDASSKQTHVVGSVLDLTESEASAALLSITNEELRNAQRVARLGSYTWELPTSRLRWSPGMYDLFGLSGSEAPSAALFFQHVHPDDAERVRRGAEVAVASRTPRNLEFRIVQCDGTVLDVVLESQAQLDPEGRILAFRGVLQDVTRRKLLEEQLRQSQKMEAVGTLAGGVAHDFNNYLMVLSGQADMLRLTLDPEHPGLMAVEAIKDACERCATLTTQLLTLSRRRGADLRHIDLCALLTRSAPLLRSVLSEASALVIACDEPNAFVHADPAQLEHAIMNLVVNARDAMPNGGRLTLTVDRVVIEREAESGTAAAAPASLIRLSVSDTGDGISPEHRSRVFEPFFTTKGVGRGTGLGLTTTYGIIKHAGGSIDVESELGRGTTFRIHLPPSDVTVAEPDALPEASIAPDAGRTVLLVEDLAEVRTLLRAQLERAGYRVLTAPHGQAALELLRESREMHETRGERETRESPTSIDVVLSDVVMPVMGGVELERKLNQSYPHIPCILMTGYAEAALGDRAENRRLLRKPFSSKDLLAALQTLWAAQASTSQPTAAPSA